MRDKIFLSFLFVFFIFYFLFFILAKVIFAQQITLSVSPPLIETTIKPGKSILIAYTLQNLADPAVFKVKILPFTPKDHSGHIDLKSEFEGPVRFSLDNSVIKMNEPFMLKKEGQQLLLRLRIPEGAPEGDYYYTLLAETQPPPVADGVVGTAAKATVGANILITVSYNGKVDVKGKIFSFDILPRIKLGNLNVFDSNDKIPVALTVENEGKNLIKPQGEIVLRGNFGERAAYAIIPQNVLAMSKRIMQATPSAEICGTGTARCAPTTLILSGFFIGKYNLSANVNFGENSIAAMANVSFIALPLKVILGIIIAAGAGILIVKKIRD